MAKTAVSPSGVRWLAFILAIVLALVVYWPTAVSLPDRWAGDPTYSHGYLVAAVSAWMVWRAWRRGELEGTRPSLFALVPLALAGLLWLLAQGSSILIVQQLMLPSLLLGAGWALFGWRGFVTLLVPIGLLFLVVPLWEALRPPLQHISTFAVGNVLQAVGIPVYLQGHQVELPAGSFEIAEGCSGLNVFMAGAALAVIQAYLFLGKTWARVLLITAALAATIVANWLRIGIIVVAGHLTDMQHWLIEDHYQFGWVTFAIMMVPVLLLGRGLERVAPPRQPETPPPELSFQLPLPAQHGRTVATTMAVLLLPGLAWWSVYHAATIAPSPILPTAAGEWRMDGEAGLDWRPLHAGQSMVLNGRYIAGAREVDAWIVYYDRQSAGRKLIGHGNAMARPEDGRLQPSPVASGELRLVTGRRDDRLLWYRYEVGGRVTASQARAKLYELRGNLRGHPSAYGAVFSARCIAPDCGDAREALHAFETAMIGRLPAMGLE